MNGQPDSEHREQGCAAQRMDALARLAGGVAHELNNVLMVISGYSEMLGEAVESNQEARESLRMIADAAQRATGLTRQLLLFGRRQPAHAQDVDVARALAALVPTIESLMPASATVRVGVEDEALLVRLDPTHFDRLVTSLAVFSRDAVQEGGTVSIEARAITRDTAFTDLWGLDAPSGDYVRLSVAHSHVAEPGARTRLFEPFFTTKPIGKGAGLTLAVAYGIVRTGGGFVDVVEEGGGSRFEVLFPLVANDERRDAAETRPPSTPCADLAVRPA